MTFVDGSTTLGTGTLDSTGHASYTTRAFQLTVGSHSITANYATDSNYATSSSSTLSQTTTADPTTTTVTSSANPSVFGQPVTFTATVTANPPGNGTPTGTVTFVDGSTTLGTGTLDSPGHASYTTTAFQLTVGSHSITAVYSGDTNFATSTSPVLSQVVNPAHTSTTLTSSANPSFFGQTVTFTATVAPVSPGAGSPTGTVDFFDGRTTIGTGILAAGVASFSTNTLDVLGSPHSITAVYVGDTNFATSTSAVLSQVVDPAHTSTTLTSSANPSVFGQTVTFTATVAAVSPGAGSPTGTVNFFDGRTNIGTGTLAAGVASFSTSTLDVSGSPHSITAVYVGDTNFATSTSAVLSQVVNPAHTSTTLTSSANPSVFGQTVTFTATVAPVSPGAGTRHRHCRLLRWSHHHRHRHPRRGHGYFQHQHPGRRHALDHRRLLW